jgi:DNA-directed RNA polymerase specialized sigma24 family protein
MLYEYLKRNNYRVLRTFEWRSSFGTWVCTVSGRLYLNMLKHQPEETLLYSKEYDNDIENIKTDDDSDDAITVNGINFTEGFIYEMLASMSTQYPDIVLRYLQGQSSRQIATGLRIPADIITDRIRNEVATHRMLHRYFTLSVRRDGAGQTCDQIILHATGIESNNVRSKLSYVITLYEKYINGKSYEDIARMLETNTANVSNNIYPRAIKRAYGTVQRLKIQAGVDIKSEITEQIEDPGDVGLLQAIYTRREDFGIVAQRLDTTPVDVAARYNYATEQALAIALYMEENNSNQRNESK